MLWPTSSDGKTMIADFEMSMGVLKEWGLGEFDTQSNLVGIYPHYVFKKDDSGKYISDGGITFGYGHWVSPAKYNSDSSAKALIDNHCPNANIIPTYIPEDGRAYKVPNSSFITIQRAYELLEQDLLSAENAVNSFLDNHEVELSQNQYDVLVSFTHQYGENWWTLVPEKVLPKFIREGKGTYNSDEVRRIFGMHDNPERRAVEAEVFINGH